MMVHLKQKPFPCPHVDAVTGGKCPQGFDTAGHLRAHEARIHGGARFACTECLNSLDGVGSSMDGDASSRPEAAFPTYALLQAHIRTVHPPTCPDCVFTCSSSRELRRHLEITHGNVSLEDRRTHPCEFPECGRNFTKRGNLNVHIRTVHEGEKRFICGETDLSTSKKIEGRTPQDSCGKRYGSKLALEEHVRTAHLGLKNTKAERREQLGLPPRSSTRSAGPSNLALLTGDGYVEESGRHIPCLIEQCQHLFRRDYDLWVHMAAKHGLEENDIQILFMQRAMHGGDHSFNFDFDTLQMEYPAPQVSGMHQMGTENGAFGDDFLMQEARFYEEQQQQQPPSLVPDDCGERVMIDYDGGNNMEAIDPSLTYTPMQ